LRAADLNLRRGNRDVRLFEVGSVFLPREAGVAPDEPLRLGLVWSGSGEPHHWSRATREVDIHDVIGVAEHLLSTVRPGSDWRRTGEAQPAFHPSHSVSWSAPDGTTVAWGGALHPELQADLDQRVFLLELARQRDSRVSSRSPACPR
jgi:phenylalanyl-tRNA synthetase beta chain